MSHFTIQVTSELHQYLQSVSVRDNDLLKALRAETAKEKLARMQISPEQGQFMALLIKLLGARRTIEVGVFTGYSALSVACALPENGQMIACDIDEGWTNIAQRYWKKAGVAHKIDLRLAPALVTLDNVLLEGQQDQFDFAFFPTFFPTFFPAFFPAFFLSFLDPLLIGLPYRPLMVTERFLTCVVHCFVLSDFGDPNNRFRRLLDLLLWKQTQ